MKGKGERERYTQLNTEFQDRTRDLFKKIGDIKGIFHARMGMIKGRDGKDLTQVEEIQKRWQDYTELYKKWS